MRRGIFVTIQSVAAICGLLAPQAVPAYDRPLSDEAVRQAYFIGQDVRNAQSFFALYTRMLPIPKSGPQVAEIELSTPYAQVVEDSAEHTVNYSAQDAATAYHRREDSISVRLKVLFTPTYINTRYAFWRSISVSLIQAGRRVTALRTSGEPIYSGDPFGGAYIGANVYAQFRASDVKSAPLQVEAVPPDGTAVRASFDLNQLR